MALHGRKAATWRRGGAPDCYETPEAGGGLQRQMWAGAVARPSRKPPSARFWRRQIARIGPPGDLLLANVGGRPDDQASDTMQCPYCQTENREDREICYACDRDLSMLRLIVNKARHHYNQALEHAERGRVQEAIDELHNATDLDRRFVSALVVLGTLLARQGKFDEARETWEKALAIQPELDKAHRYLDKVESVRAVTPTVRNLQVVSAFLLLLAVVLVVMVFYMKRRDDSASVLKAAQAAYDAGHYGDALAQLDRIDAQKVRWEIVPLAASALRSAVESDQRQSIQLIQDMKHRGDYQSALEAIVALEKREPDEVTSETLAAIRGDISHYFRTEIGQTTKDFKEGRVPYTELAKRIAEFTEIYPDVADKEGLRQSLEEARSIEVERRLEAIRADFREVHDFESTLAALQVLASEFSGSEAASKGRGRAIEEMLNYAFDQVQAMTARGEFGEAQAMLMTLASLAAEFADIVDVTDTVNLYSEHLGQARVDARLKTVEKLAREGDTAEAEDALVDLMVEVKLSAAELAFVDSLGRRVDERESSAALATILDRQADYLSLKVSDKTASSTLDGYEFILASLPDLSQAKRARLLACAASAAVRLGRADLAAQIAARFEKEKPEKVLETAVQKIIKARKR